MGMMSLLIVIIIIYFIGAIVTCAVLSAFVKCGIINEIPEIGVIFWPGFIITVTAITIVRKIFSIVEKSVIDLIKEEEE
jgi:hypothetical protein